MSLREKLDSMLVLGFDREIELSDSGYVDALVIAGNKPTVDKLLKKRLKNVVKEDRGYKSKCWIWQGGTDRDGYGTVNEQVAGKRVREQAHRWFYKALVGEIGVDEKGETLTVDHLCEVRLCVNPSHHELVTHVVNIQRMHSRTRERRDAAGLVGISREALTELKGGPDYQWGGEDLRPTEEQLEALDEGDD